MYTHDRAIYLITINWKQRVTYRSDIDKESFDGQAGEMYLFTYK